MSEEVHYRGKDDACCGILYLKHVLYIFNAILLVRAILCRWLGSIPWQTIQKNDNAFCIADALLL